MLSACLLVSGCLTIGATLAGLGFSDQMSGIQYHTFTQPLPKVSHATLAALKRMAFKLDKVEPTKTGALIRASTTEHKFEVQLEALTPSTTRVRALTRNRINLIDDGSIAQEIIRQTGKALEPEPVPVRRRSGT